MPCKQKQKGCLKLSIPSNKGSWLSAILIILLPKCPFCVMAYSGAMTMCSGKMIYPNSSSESTYFLAFLSILVLAGIAFNFKGFKTLISLGIAIVGISFLILSQVYWYSEIAYYLSVFIIVMAIWLNGSLTYFLRYIENLLFNQNRTIQS